MDADANGIDITERMHRYGDTATEKSISEMEVGDILVDNFHYGTYYVRIA